MSARKIVTETRWGMLLSDGTVFVFHVDAKGAFKGSFPVTLTYTKPAKGKGKETQ